MGDAVPRKSSARHNQAVCANRAVDAHSHKVARLPRMTVEQNHFGDRPVFERDGLIASAQADDVSGVEGIRPPAAGLPSLYGEKPGTHEAAEHLRGGNEGVLGRQAVGRRGREHRRCTAADGLERERAIEDIGV